MKRTVEIDDDLEERVEGVEEELKEDFINYLKENKDIQDFDEYYQDQGCDRVSDFTDSATPIYYSSIDGLYYLYSSEFEEAFENAGVGENKEDNHKQMAIYFYLEEKGHEYLNELKEAFDDIFNYEDDDIDELIKHLEEDV